ncbi:hypothetical protein PIROE2DRAFT_62399 [Piromyces sp. E2]|nr:hypothetical protein PIROE2DRAFT_62399 [Piromyces sp. E2]|eukprot:OUM61608.1 hypothetical protein PIROE2DRAFT_62399 [Piromyces sp. E2]
MYMKKVFPLKIISIITQFVWLIFIWKENQTDIIILDEPTFGMDEESKEKIWESIQEIQNNNSNSTFIIGTSSIEEALTLSDRICILVNGNIKCIGTAKELEKNHCQRFILKIQSKYISEFQQKVMEDSHLFDADYIIEDEFNSFITYNVSLRQSLGNVFKVMEKYKSSGLLTEYSFNKLTLEQVYLNYSKYQKRYKNDG